MRSSNLIPTASSAGRNGGLTVAQIGSLSL